jgi:hypothetical protein
MGSQAVVAQTATVTTVTPRQDVVPDTAPIPGHVKQRILDHMKQSDLQRLHGWPGLVFYCPVEEAKTDTIKAICTRVNAQIGATMAAANIKFQIAKNAFDLHFLPHMTGRLLLVVELEATPSDSQPSAMFAELEALAHYAHAVNWSSELHPAQETIEGRSPLEVPQHVNAILWESKMITAATGSQAQLEDVVFKSIQEKIAAFLVEFAKVNKK